MSFVQPAGSPLIVAHRGMCGGNIPPNSKAALTAAFLHGADVIEIDVALSYKKELYVCHSTMEGAHLSSGVPIRLLGQKQIEKRRFVNQDGAKTYEAVMTLDDAMELLKGKCLINIDKFWTAPAEITNVIRRHGMEKQVIIKAPAKEKHLRAVEYSAPDLPFIAIVKESDSISKKLLKRNINFIGIEAIFMADDSPVVSDEHIEWLHSNGLAIWGNSIVYNTSSVIAADHTDDTAICGDPEKGWGWFADKGFDFIQTDWLTQLKTYLSARPRNLLKNGG